MNENLDVESLVYDYILVAEGPFTAEDCTRSIIDEMPESSKDRTKLIRSVERELRSSPLTFRNPDRKFFQSISSIFKGGSFLIAPDAFEIENGILFPGDRLTPFCSEDVFPSDAILINEQNELEFDSFEFTAPMDIVLPFHILLGSEQVFDYFIADHDVNEGLFSDGAPDGDVTLTVFDFSEFYAEHNFAPGDAILLRIDSWTEAAFSCSFVSGTSRIADADKWTESFTGAMEQVIDYFENYLEIPEQVAWAYFLGDKKLLQSPGASVSEFTDRSDRVKIIYSGGHTVLGICSPEDAESDAPPTIAAPEGVSVSSGETDDLDVILKEIQCPLNKIELESYCYSELWRRQYDFDAFFVRCFGQEKLSFTDDAQEASFMNYVEDIWERAEAVYNVNLDEIKAPVREQILELVDARAKWFEFVLELGVDPQSLEQEAIGQMKEVSLHLCTTLNMLNDPKQELLAEDAENMVEAIASVGEMQEDCIERLTLA
jgi:hypothetical protein